MNETTEEAVVAPFFRRPWVYFVRHLVEMMVAMFAGMLLLDPVWEAVYSGTFARADLGALAMATNMTVGMAIWMRYRGHAWAPVAEMGAAMYVPYLVLLIPFWAGVMPGESVADLGHLLMMVAMVLIMVRRRAEYSKPHQAHAPNAGKGILAVLRQRWPSLLALVMTFDLWIEPAVPAPWFLLGLPLAYLAIGAVRKQLRDPGMLALQTGGLIGYTLLVLIALAVEPEVARYLVAGGWLAHAVWDVAHYVANKVVPRGYAEWCAILDAVIGITIIFLI